MFENKREKELEKMVTSLEERVRELDVEVNILRSEFTKIGKMVDTTNYLMTANAGDIRRLEGYLVGIRKAEK
jgi:hypothetical protein